MQELAEDVFHLPLSPRSSVNAYLIGDVLIDAGFSWQAGRVLSAVRGRVVTQHVLTHAHVDHVGGSRKVVDTLHIPVQVGARDLVAAHTGHSEADLGVPRLLRKPARSYSGFPPVPEATALFEGDTVGPGFKVLNTPGHSPGHISLWRERDGVLICGDVINSMNLLTTRAGIQEPPGIFTPDPVQNRASIRLIAALEPRLTLVGHGPPVKDPAALPAFAAGLPQD